MNWREQGKCANFDPDLWFDQYEEDQSIRKIVDDLCISCPVQQQCFGTGVTGKEWGVWGGVYLKDGSIDQEFNSHKTSDDWAALWESLTLDRSNVY